mmetsp:Transcript_38381/g.80364  ORF Transcript_38381/g.80364 Transcript_38381/m.80364 type:complete len:326 (+) Transcript_38381:26-1003(+)
MFRFFLFLAAIASVAVAVEGFARSSSVSSSRVSSDTARNAVEAWTEADLIKDKIQADNSQNDDTVKIPRDFHIKAELLDPKSAFATAEELTKADRETDDSNVVATKIVHFQRHGQGYHNLLGDVLRDVGVRPDIHSSDASINPWLRSEIVDSPLTALGKQQCEGQRSVASLLKPDVVIVSPLLRAIETAKLSFADYDGEVPWLAHEGCREELGWLVCNKRRKLSEIKANFPDIEFPPNMTEEDTLWDPSGFESETHKGNRVYDFLVNFLAERPEHNIAVVCHSAWLSHMCNDVLDCGGDPNMTSWFDVSEIRSMKLTFTKADAAE